MTKPTIPTFNERTEAEKLHLPTPNELEAQQDKEETQNTSFDGALGGGDLLHEGIASEFVVDWDGENDPANPMNWSKNKRILQVIFASAITMVTLVPL